MTNEELVNEIKSGINTTNNMAALYKRNRGMIALIARRYQSKSEFDDLMQEGYLGLCRAVDAYDSAQGVTFLSYAEYWIRQGMQRYIEDSGTCVRMPSGRQQQIREYNKIERLYLGETGEKPEKSTLCKLLGVSPTVLAEIEKSMEKWHVLSLDTPIGDEGDSTLCDLIPDDSAPYAAVLDEIQHEELKAVLWPIVDALGERESKIIRGRYQDGKTLKALGEEIGVTTESVRQSERKAIRALRNPAPRKKLQPFIEERIRSKALIGTGVNTFNRTWTSATERVALEDIERKLVPF